MTDRTLPRGRVHSPGAVLDVQPYDFESPELVTGEDRDRLDVALAAWAQQVGVQVTAKTRAVADVAASPSRVQSYGAVVASAADEEPVLWGAVRIDGSRALYRVPVAEARYWAARMLGALDGGPGDRPLTAVERGLARHAAADHVAELKHGTDGLLPDGRLVSLAAEPPAGFDPNDQAVVVDVVLIRRGVRRRLSLAVDVALVLERLGAIAPEQDAEEVADRVTRHLALAPVEVALCFDVTPVGPDLVLDLAPGDLIPIAHLADQPLAITVDGVPLLRAAVGGNGERLACVVVDSNGDLR